MCEITFVEKFLRILNIERLDDRRLMASAMFCFKTITGMIDDSEYDPNHQYEKKKK